MDRLIREVSRMDITMYFFSNNNNHSELDESDEDICGSSTEILDNDPIVPPPRPTFKEVALPIPLAIGEVKRGEALDEPRKIRGEEVPLGLPRPGNESLKIAYIINLDLASLVGVHIHHFLDSE